MYHIFIDLFPILNKAKNIDNFEDLIKFEDILESTIQNSIKNFKEERRKSNEIMKNDDKDITSFINLLKEKYAPKCYIPFYENFYYTDYLNEII